MPRAIRQVEGLVFGGIAHRVGDHQVEHLGRFKGGADGRAVAALAGTNIAFHNLEKRQQLRCRNQCGEHAGHRNLSHEHTGVPHPVVSYCKP